MTNLNLSFDNFQVELVFLGKSHKSIYRYTFYDLEFSDEPLFVGSDFELSPLVDDESVETIAHLLGFLSCDRMSVGEEYFKDYSDRQLDWIDNWSERVELLQYWTSEIEELADVVDEMYCSESPEEMTRSQCLARAKSIVNNRA